MTEAGSLSYRVRPYVVAKQFGRLALQLGALTIVPMLFAFLDGERGLAAGTAVAVAVLLGVGALLARLEAADDVQTNEAIVVVALIFVLASLSFALPMMAAHVTFLDALFEAVSGITTTGLSTFASIADKPRSLLFEVAWLQWIGGLGIMVLSAALVFGQGVGAKQLSSVMTPPDGFLAGTRAHASVVIRVYVVLTLAGVAALAAAGADGLSAVLLTLAAVSTGGYAPYDASLMGLAPALQTVTVVLCVTGAIAMPLYHEAARGHWRVVLGDPELKLLLVAGAFFATLLCVRALALHTGGRAHLGELVLLAFSAQSTAGFSTVDVASLDAFSKLVLISAMVVGGGVGSSAGGIKLLRIIVLVKLVQLMILRTRVTRRTVTQLRIGGRERGDDEVLGVLLVMGLHLGTIVLSWSAFLWLGYDPLDGLFEVVSAVGTAGLSSGITGPDLQPFLKGILCFDMLLGRLEVLPFLVLLAPHTWIGRARMAEPAQSAAGATE